MSQITITLTNVCSGGNHLTFTSSGAVAMSVTALLDDLQQPITDDEAVVFVKVIGQMAKIGRTLNQTKTLLQAGVTVTV